MILPEHLADFLDDASDAAQRSAIDRQLQQDPESLHFVIAQWKTDRMLRSVLGADARRQALKDSILATLATPPVEMVRRRILAEIANDLTSLEAPTDRPRATPKPFVSPSTANPDQHGSWFGWLQVRFLTVAAATALVLGFLGWWVVPRHRATPRFEVGELSELVGAPNLRRLGQRLPVDAVQGFSIEVGDRLETGDADRAEIRFNDGTLLRLAFNTAVELPPATALPRNATNTLLRPPEIRLLKGQVWTKVQKLTNATPYAIRTDAATATARGTEFGVRLQHGLAGATNGAPEAVLTVKEGTVDFANAHGSVRATAMTECRARAESAPTEPKRLQTLQMVQLPNGAEWSILSSALDWPEVAERLALGGGWAGLRLRTLTSAGSTSTVTSTAEVRVAQVRRGSPAEQAGLRPGDVLWSLNGTPVTNLAQFHRATLLHPGSTLDLRVRRDGAEHEFRLAVIPRPSLLPGTSLNSEEQNDLAAVTRSELTQPPPVPSRTERADSNGGNALRAAVWNNRGVVAELGDAMGPAIQAYRRSVDADPAVPLYHYNLGLALRKIGNFERAAAELANAVRLSPGSTEPRKRLAEVRSLLGDHEGALSSTESALASVPEEHGLWELKAQVLTKLGRNSEAETAARRAVELDPGCPVARSYLGTALANQHQPEAAEAVYREALALAPYDAPLHNNLGAVQVDRGTSASGEQSFRRAIELQPDFALAHRNLGTALLDRRDYAAAAASFHAAAATEPNDPVVLWGLGEVALRRLRLDEAEAAFRKAIEFQPEFAAPHTGLGFVLYKRGRIDEAEKEYHRAIELKPSDPAPYLNLGTLCREARRDLDAAEHWFRRALDRAPNDADALGGLGLVAKSRNNLKEADRLLRQALEQAPGSSALHNNLGEVLRLRGNLEEAERHYRQAIELDPDSPSAYGNLGILQAGQKQFAEAEKTFRSLLDRSVGNARIPSLINLANVCGELGKVQEAERYFRQTLDLAPGDPRVMISLASFLSDRRIKLDEALTFARRATESVPNDPRMLGVLGWIQAQRGDLDDAERTLSRALDLAGEESPAPEIRAHLQAARQQRILNPQPMTPNKP